jgi:hypothetical protein
MGSALRPVYDFEEGCEAVYRELPEELDDRRELMESILLITFSFSAFPPLGGLCSWKPDD